MNGKVYQQMLDILKNELPSNRPLQLGASEVDHIYANGIEVGYRQCIATLESLAIPIQQQAAPEASFGDDE